MRQTIIKNNKKQCGHCKKMKVFSKFTKDNRASCGLKSECNDCRTLDRKKRRKNKRERIYKIKENTPCADCNQYYPSYVMQFDHLPGNKKEFQLSNGYLFSDISIKKEISKCELVCANCHAIRTHKRK